MRGAKKNNPELYLYFFSVGIVLILGTLWWLEMNNFVRSQELTALHSPHKTIIAFGDSLSSGYGVGWELNYVGILKRRIGQPIVIAAQSGRTTAKALAVLDKEVISRKPDIVIVLLGGNDFIHGVPEATLFGNLRQIVLRIKAAGTKVILVGIPAGFSDEYDRKFEALATDTGSAYVPNVLKGILGNKNLLLDQFHPNIEGHKIMADRIYKVLEPLLQTHQ